MTVKGSGARIGQSGFSLVEILVTTVILGIGVLGVTGLTAYSKRAAFETVQRSTATELAFALLEDMRANSTALDVYVGAGTLGRGSRGAEPAPTCDTAGSPCTAAELAAHGLWAWEQMLDTGLESVDGAATGGLVQATACIDGPATGEAGTYSVTIAWRGVTELTDPAANTCGDGTGLYGANNEYRRMVVLQTYIDPSI